MKVLDELKSLMEQWGWGIQKIPKETGRSLPTDYYGVPMWYMKSLLEPEVPRDKMSVSLNTTYGDLFQFSTTGEAGQRYNAVMGLFPDMKYADLSRFFLPQTRQGMGIVTRVFAKLIPVCEVIGIERWEMEAADAGRYVWPKFGFNARDNSVAQRYSRVLELAPWLSRAYPEPPAHMLEVAVMNTIGTAGRFYSWMRTKFSSAVWSKHFKGPNGEFLVGKYVLLTEDKWPGGFHLRGKSRQIMDGYLKAKGIPYQPVPSGEEQPQGQMGESVLDDTNEDLLMRQLAGQKFGKTVVYEEVVTESIERDMDKQIEEAKKLK